MTVTVANVDINSDTFLSWANKTSQLANTMSTKVVTVGGSSYSTTGNAHIIGSMQANAFYAETGLYGGTIASGNSLIVQSNAIFNSNAVLSNTSTYTIFGSTDNIRMTGSNTTHRSLSVDSSNNTPYYEQVISVGTTGSNVATGNAIISGTFGANTLHANKIGGGNNTVLSTANVFTNASFTNSVHFSTNTFLGSYGEATVLYVNTLRGGTSSSPGLITINTTANLTSNAMFSGSRVTATANVVANNFYVKNIWGGNVTSIGVATFATNVSFTNSVYFSTNTYLGSYGEASTLYVNTLRGGTSTSPSTITINTSATLSNTVNFTGTTVTATANVNANNVYIKKVWGGTSSAIASINVASNAEFTNNVNIYDGMYFKGSGSLSPNTTHFFMAADGTTKKHYFTQGVLLNTENTGNVAVSNAFVSNTVHTNDIKHRDGTTLTIHTNTVFNNTVTFSDSSKPIVLNGNVKFGVTGQDGYFLSLDDSGNIVPTAITFDNITGLGSISPSNKDMLVYNTSTGGWESTRSLDVASIITDNHVTAGANVYVGSKISGSGGTTLTVGANSVIEGTANISGNVAITGASVRVSSSNTATIYMENSGVTRYLKSNTTATYLYGSPQLYLNGTGSKVWHENNDGAGSGLDADQLDGQEGSYYNSLASSAYTNATSYAATIAGTAYSNAITIANTYSNATNILTKLSTVDGAGSGLDADKLDGVQLSTIRTEITGNSATAYTNATSYAATIAGTAYSNATSYAATIAGTAYSNAVSTASSDASSKAATSYSNATSYAASIAGTAYTNATSYAATIAGTAYANAIVIAAAYSSAANTLSKLLTVDGATSGLDADKLDGVELSTIRTEISSNATSTYNNAIAYSANASKLSSGTVASARLSGTYSIDISGNAGSVDGYSAAEAATGSTVAARTSSGYLYATYFNTNHAASGATGDTVFYSSTDDFIRKNNSTGMRASLNVPTRSGGDASGTWGINITGNANYATTAGNADTVDSLHAGSFIRSDADDYVTGNTQWQDSKQIKLGTGGDLQIYHDGTNAVLNNDTGSFLFYEVTGGSYIWHVAGDNKLQLDSSGNLTAAGNITAYSDVRLKKEIKTIDNALNKVTSLRGVNFIKDEEYQMGVIAQEVEEIIPEVILTNNEGIKSVAYGNMVGLLIEAIKELKAEIEELKGKN